MGAANVGRKSAPPKLRVLKGSIDSDGNERDSGGRLIAKTPNFVRVPPEKPFDLEGDAAWLWDLIVEQMGRLELLKPLDAPSLEMVCETYARWKHAVTMRRRLGSLGQNSQGTVVAPWVRVEESAGKEFRAWCAEYGLTPAAENKIATGVSTDDDVNPFE